MTGVLLSDDLIDASRIVGATRAAGLDVKTARTVEQLLQLVGDQKPTCVVVDLHHPGLDVADLVRRSREPEGVAFRVVAYGSHVDAARLKAARTAGCQLVLPRSAFFERLPQEIESWLTSADAPGAKDDHLV